MTFSRQTQFIVAQTLSALSISLISGCQQSVCESLDPQPKECAPQDITGNASTSSSAIDSQPTSSEGSSPTNSSPTTAPDPSSPTNTLTTTGIDGTDTNDPLTSGDSTADGSATTPPVQSTCGNGEVETGEQCDDSNTIGTDTCTEVCKFATCGDGRVQAGVEHCDDGNNKNNDGCSSLCVFECGDGKVTGTEECDDGEQASEFSFCSVACTRQGKYVFVTSEDFNGDLCSNWCGIYCAERIGCLDTCIDNTETRGGVSCADKICKHYGSQLASDSEFMAWIGGSVDGNPTALQGPSTRFAMPNGPYFLPKNEQNINQRVAISFEDLVDGTPLEAKINITELEKTLPPPDPSNPWTVWANVSVAGVAIDDSSMNSGQWSGKGNCNDWHRWLNNKGRRGQNESLMVDWTGTYPSQDNCADEKHLYCFEQ